MIPVTPGKEIVYSSSRYRVLAASLLSAMLAASSAHAADVIKANNTTALNAAGSWSSGSPIPPDSTAVAVWNNTVTGANTSALGGNVSWQGIRIANNAGGDVTINGSTGATLTLGSAGIDLSVANRNLTFGTTAVPVILSANQTWNIGSSRTLTFNANGGTGTNIDLNGKTLSTSGSGNIIINNKNNLTSATPATLDINNASFSFESGGSTAVSISSNITTNIAANRILQLRGNSGSGGVGVNSNGLVNVNGGIFRIAASSAVLVNQAGKVSLTNNSTLDNTVNVAGARFNLTGELAVSGSTIWNESGASANTATTFSGPLTGNGTLDFKNTSAVAGRRADWSGNNTAFTGTVNINGGSGNRNLRLTTATAGSSSATWAPSSGNTLEVDGVAVNFGTLNGAGTVTNSHATNVAAITVGSGSFSGAITNGTPANGMSLTKTGNGTLSLTGANTYSGLTDVQGGTLSTTTLQTGGGAISVANTATLHVTQNSAAATFNSANLTLAGGSTLSLTPAASPSTAVVTAPTFNVEGATTLRVNGSSLGDTTLVDYTGAIGGASGFGGLTLVLPFRITGDFTNDLVATAVKLSNVQVNTPKWTGAVNSTWDVTSDATGNTGATANWQTSASLTSTRYVEAGVGQVDSVIFDDSASGSTAITLNTTVSPVSISVSNTSKDYSISGTGSIAGTGSLAKSGSGNLTLATSNSFNGGVQLNGGTLNVNNNGALGAGTLTITAGTTLDNTSGSAKVTTNAQNWNGNFTFTGTNDLTLGTAALNADRQVTVSGGTLTVGSVSGSGFGLTKDGAGTLALGAGSTYSGATVVNGGVLKAAAASAFSAASSVALANNAGVAIDLNGFNQTINTITGGGATGGNIVLNGAVLTTGTTGNITFAGALNSGSAAGGLTKQGAGTLTLSGDKSGYTGTTNVTAGTLDLDTINGNFGAPVTVTAGTANNSIVVGSGLFVQGNGVLNTGISGGSAGFGARGGNLTVNVGGAGAMINRNSGGTLGLGQMIFGSATSDSRVIVQNEIGINNNGGTRDITVNVGTGAASAEIAGVISGGTAGGVSGIIKKGNGDLILSNANTYIGNTTIDAGRIVLGHAQALQFSALNTASVGKVSATGFATPTLGGLTGSTNLATVIDSGYTGITTLTLSPQTGQSQSYSGVIADGAVGMNVTKTGAGTQTFTATQTYTGSTNVNAGTLALGHATNTLADSGAVSVGGGTLALGANSDTVGVVTLTSGSITGTGTLSGSSYDVRSGTVSAILGGSGGLTKSSAGTVTLSGTNNYSGATVVNGGVLELIGTGSINNTSGITVDGGLFKNNSSVAITQPFTFTSGTIGGTNLSGVSVSVGTSQTLSPGNSPGTMTTGTTTFANGGTYVWEINDATVGGQGTKWDLLVADSLTISAGTAGFTVNIVSLVNPTNVAGNATAFDPEVNSYFLFANTASEIASFSSTAFAVNTSGFSNTFTGTWTIKRGDDAAIIGGDNTELYVSYAPIPEPSAYAALVGLGAIGLTLSRRRRRQHN